jgi:Mitochondrial carrier protein
MKSSRFALHNQCPLAYIFCRGRFPLVHPHRAATTTTYPLQLIKSRMQQRADSIELTDDGRVRAVKREYMGLIATARRIYTREGITGFFKGCIPNAVRVAPGAAITFVVYEEVSDLLS